MTTLEEQREFWDGVSEDMDTDACAERHAETQKDRGGYVGLRRDENGAEKGRGRILQEAHDIINGQRQTEYGNPEDSFRDIAFAWNWWIGERIGGMTVITAADVAMMMTLFKAAREKCGAGKKDNIRDACGYLGLYWDLMEEEKI